MSSKLSIPALGLLSLTACEPSQEEVREHKSKVWDIRQQYNKKGLEICNDPKIFAKVTTQDIGTAEFAHEARRFRYFETMRGSADHYSTYTASSSPLRGIEDLDSWQRDRFELKSYMDYFVDKPVWVTGLPPSLIGSEINITSKIDTKAFPYAVHLGADKTEDGPDYYKISSGISELKNGVKADTLTILGDLDYCVNTNSFAYGSNADFRQCTERFGQLTVVIKPDDFDSKCADLRSQLEQEIDAIE